MVTGRGLDPWGAVPGLRRLTVVGRVLRADAGARRAYAALLEDAAFRSPLHWGAARRSRLRRAGAPRRPSGPGDAPVPREPRGAADGRRRLPGREAGRRHLPRRPGGRPGRGPRHRAARCCTGGATTALTWALERKAWGIARWSRFWDPSYYRTYVEEPGQPWGYMSVQQEVTRALADPGDFADVARGTRDWRRKTSGRARDSLDDARPAWVVRDGSYVSARWPGDAHTFARTFAEVLADRPDAQSRERSRLGARRRQAPPRPSVRTRVLAHCGEPAEPNGSRGSRAASTPS